MTTLQTPRWGRREQAGGFLLPLVALSWGGVSVWMRPDLWFGAGYFDSDPGLNLLWAREISQGKWLYRDVFCPYGPLPVYLYAGVAALFGNTAQSYLGLIYFSTVAQVVLVYLVLRCVLAGWRLFTFALFAVFPVFLQPGPFTHGYCEFAYPCVERTLLLCLLLCWEAVPRRSSRRALLLGLFLGAMQWTKFGTAFAAGAAVGLVDLAFLGRAGLPRELVRRWFRTSLCILAGFVALEGTLAICCFSLLPGLIAMDVLWPSYMVQNYAGSVDPSSRWPHWFGLSFFLTRELGLLLSLGLVLLVAWRLVGRRQSPTSAWSEGQEGRFLLGGVFFIVGLFTTFQHVILIYSFAWIFALAGAPAFSRLKPLWMALLLVGWSFCLALNLKLLNPREIPLGVAARSYPPIGKLWVDEPTDRRVRMVDETLRALDHHVAKGEQPSVLMLPELDGLYYYLSIEPATRCVYFMPGLVRPYDERKLIDSLSRTSAVVVWDVQKTWTQIPTNPAQWTHFGQNPFSPAFCHLLQQRLGEPIRIDATCWVIPLQPPE